MTNTTQTLKDRIIEMMTENTGINMLDSGGANWYLDAPTTITDTDWKYDADTNIVTCNKCGKPIRFNVMEGC